MPRNRRALDRDAKQHELLDAAEESFVAEGWDATTVAAIARAAGVTATTVHWYFPTKDDLLAAVIRRWADVTVAELEAVAPRLTRDKTATLVGTALGQLQPLLAVLHERSGRSAAVAELHDELHRRLAATLETHVGPDAAAAFVLLVEAVLSHGSADDHARLVGHAVETLASAAGA